MACCAFAVFLLGQACIVFEALMRFFGREAAAVQANPATDWYPGAAPALAARSSARWWWPTLTRRVAVMGGFSAVALAVTVGVHAPHDDHGAASASAAPAPLCGASRSTGN